ncbi:hypothetical protein C8R43DRAFT_983743 [Mycena crocata]|nr:hypothetical protein C8R43DRAFT_983743 [Mycena crocata]
MQDEGDSEYALRIHIRQLLLNYAMTHLTTDYIQLTEQAVADLWFHYLVEIPTADPTSLILSTDSFETLTRIYGLSSVEALQEKFQSTPSAIQYLKKLIKPQTGKLKADRVVVQESNFESHVPAYRPMSPILTTRAIRETPRLGTNTFLKSLPHSHREFLSSQTVLPVDVEPVSEPSVKQDDVLDTTWRLRPEEHEAIRSLLQSIRPKGYKNRHLDPCARPDSPPIASRIPDPPFIPIFPRRGRAGSGVREPTSDLQGVENLPTVILPPVKIEELEPDLHEQNMVIVDGWHAYKSSPSPTPTPVSSQEDQIDELFMSSPDTTPPPVRPTKMEVTQIPRTKRIGAERKKPAPIGAGPGLGSFLVPLIQEAQPPKPVSRPSPEPATSMLGQPDSTYESTADIFTDELDTDVGQLYDDQRQDPRDLILREKVDEKRQLLIEVDVLPPPNEHRPNALFLPSHLEELVAPLKAKGQANDKNSLHKFLKKAKGIPSLNVELSWVPIAARTRIPSHSEILKVTDLFDANIASFSDLPTRLATLLETICSLTDSELRPHSDTWSRRYGELVSDVTSRDSDPVFELYEIILSRKERRRIAGLPDELETDGEDSDDAMDQENDLIDARCSKRPRLEGDEYFNDSGVASNTLDSGHGNPTFSSFYGHDEPNPCDVDKENLPPYHDHPDYDRDFDFEDLTFPGPDEQFNHITRPAFPADFQANQDYPGMPYEHREFEALSFDSFPATSAQPTQFPANGTNPSDEVYAGMFEPNPNAIVNDCEIVRPSSSSTIHTAPPEIATRSLGIAEFARLRARKVTASVSESQPTSPVENALFEEPSHIVPESIYDRNTLRLPPTWNPPDSFHRYMVSMKVVQKLGLLRSLRSRACCIDLVERDSLGGVDIALDPHTAVIFTNLLTLPSECADLTSRIGQQSWLYSRLLIIFEAYPSSHSYQSKGSSNAASELFAYSPPVLKALGKLRRDLGILEGCGTKRRDCAVQYAFADSVDEAAMFTRYFGDSAEANDESRGAVWGDRAWLDDDVAEVTTCPRV